MHILWYSCHTKNQFSSYNETGNENLSSFCLLFMLRACNYESCRCNHRIYFDKFILSFVDVPLNWIIFYWVIKVYMFLIWLCSCYQLHKRQVNTFLLYFFFLSDLINTSRGKTLSMNYINGIHSIIFYQYIYRINNIFSK